jgi:hypothetical protein
MNRRQSSVIEAWKKLELKLREGAKVEQVKILISIPQLFIKNLVNVYFK